MIEEDKKLKHIGGKHLTKITPEMEKEIDKFAEYALPVVDSLIRDIEIINDSEEEGRRQ
ncbi:MAG: hypothetical protein LBG43_01210 [Treponema sp.]|jgi:hypothetical protein|nr:hypothetical protein [Treponema sp.]